MKWEEYLELSGRTLSEEFHIGNKIENSLHAVMGLATEIDELFDNYYTDVEDTTNILEEIGDALWYLAILHREYPSITRFSGTKVKIKIDKPFDCVLNLNRTTIKLLDILKKKIFYNKPIDETVFYNLVLLIETDIYWLANHYMLDMEDICDVNINKLKARYGNKFSSEKAINRDLKIERKVLEDK